MVSVVWLDAGRATGRPAVTDECTRDVSLADVATGDASWDDLRAAILGCDCVVCADYSKRDTPPVGRQRLDDL